MCSLDEFGIETCKPDCGDGLLIENEVCDPVLETNCLSDCTGY